MYRCPQLTDEVEHWRRWYNVTWREDTASSAVCMGVLVVLVWVRDDDVSAPDNLSRCLDKQRSMPTSFYINNIKTRRERCRHRRWLCRSSLSRWRYCARPRRHQGASLVALLVNFTSFETVVNYHPVFALWLLLYRFPQSQTACDSLWQISRPAR